MLDFVKKKWFTHKYKSYDLDKALSVVVHNQDHLQYLSDQFKDHLDVVALATIPNAQNIVYASPRIKNSRDTLAYLAEFTPWILYELDKIYDIDKELALTAVSADGSFIAEVSIDLKNDIDIGYEAIIQNGNYLSIVGEQLQENRTFVLDAIRYGCGYEYISYKLQYDESILFALLHKETISDEQWPTIRQALIDNPSAFLHPPQVISDLLEENPDKFLILAQRALTYNVNTELMTNELDDIEL